MKVYPFPVLTLDLADMDKDYDAVLKVRRHLIASALKSSLKPIYAIYPEKVLGLQGWHKLTLSQVNLNQRGTWKSC